VGLPHPINVLALGSTVDDIVNMSAITVNQVAAKRKKRG
jgi:phosphotransacetylase